MSMVIQHCPGCGHGEPMEVFYQCKNIPVNNVALFHVHEHAVNCPKGDINLVCCPVCGLIFNVMYDKTACCYDDQYEESQAHSGVFSAFQNELADYLIRKFDLRRKRILEIGCGKGDFLNLICARGDNEGIGYDPAYVPERSCLEKAENVTIFHRKFAPGPDYAGVDFVICKMTLEHIPDTALFLGQIRNSIAPGTKVFFQVPDAEPVLSQSRFWDIYYEHSSYFTKHALARIFGLCGYTILELSEGYDRQYLLLEGEASVSGAPAVEDAAGISEVKRMAGLGTALRHSVSQWKKELEERFRQGESVVLWGGGSKAVSFLTTMEISDAIQAVVDINPHKKGTFLPGTGHEVIAPADLRNLQPDLIIVMNPVYLEEINTLLRELKVDAPTMPVVTKSGSDV